MNWVRGRPWSVGDFLDFLSFLDSLDRDFYVLFHLRHHHQRFYYVLCHLGHRQQHLSLLNRRVFFVTSGYCDNDSTHSYTSLLLLPSGPRIHLDNLSHSPRTQADGCDNLRKEREFGIIIKQGKA